MEQEEQNELLFVSGVLKTLNLTHTEETFNHHNTLSESEKDYVKLLWTLSGDPTLFEESYTNLKTFIECSLDTDRDELAIILYPIFVRMYLELVYNEYSSLAITFLIKFGPEQDPFYQNDIQKLAMINSKDLMTTKKLDDCFTISKFLIPMSRRRSALLKLFLQIKQDMIVLHIVEVYMNIDIYEESQTNEKKMVTSNKTVKKPLGQCNKININNNISNSSQSKRSEGTKHGVGVTLEKPNGKRGNGISKIFETEEYACVQSPTNYISIIDLKTTIENNHLQKFKKYKPLPSIFTHTSHSKKHTVICATFSEDGSILSLGFHDGLIQVLSLTENKLKLIKSAENLEHVGNAETGESIRNLFGHEGPIFSVSFSNNTPKLLSCSQDNTIRLWSLLLWNCVFVYNTSQLFQTWDVKFSPFGNYFVSASSDNTAKLWVTQYKDPIRIFTGHFSDVDCIQFHPKFKYVATGSSDFQIILWDCVTGDQVCVMTGHKSAIYSLAFSRCGTFLVSGGTDSNILVWHVSCNLLLTVLTGHKNKITALAFSRCGKWLSSGSLDCTVKYWDFSKLSKDLLKKILNTKNTYLIATYRTKMSPFVALHFTQKTLLSVNFLQ